MKSYDELQDENRLLRQRLAQYQHMESAAEAVSGNEATAHFLESHRLYELHLKKSYIGYLAGNFKNSVFFRFYRRISKFFRPTLFIVRIIRWLLFILTFVQTSVVLLFATVLSLIMLPVIGLIALVAYVIIFHERRKLSKKMEALFGGKRVLVFMSSDARSPFFDSNMHSLSDDYTVIVVKEGGGLFGDDGVDERGRRRRFLTAREMTPQYFLVRQNYYFYLRKKYFKKAAMLAMIY